MASRGPRRKARKNALSDFTAPVTPIGLQRGRAGRRGKTVRLSAGRVVMVEASTGPRRKARKNFDVFLRFVFRAMLQRGRAGRRGKTWTPARIKRWSASFNGAAPEGAEKLSMCNSFWHRIATLGLRLPTLVQWLLAGGVSHA